MIADRGAANSGSEGNLAVDDARRTEGKSLAISMGLRGGDGLAHSRRERPSMPNNKSFCLLTSPRAARPGDIVSVEHRSESIRGPARRQPKGLYSSVPTLAS